MDKKILLLLEFFIKKETCLKQTDKNGLPIFEKKGNRIWYTGSDGLARFYLDRILDLGSNGVNLQGSYAVGRVVVVSAVGASQNLEKYISELNAERKRQDQETELKLPRLAGLCKIG